MIPRRRPTEPVWLVLLAAAMFFPALAGRRFFAIDFHLTFEPLRHVLGQALADGLPEWNPWIGNGAPLLANPMQAAFYPPNVLFAVVDAATGLTWLAILHLVFGAVGAARLARELGSGRAGAFAAGTVFGIGGATVSAISFCNLSWSAAWLPWIVLAVERIVRRGPSPLRVLALGISTGALLVLGDPFLLLAGAWSAGIAAVAGLWKLSVRERAARIGGLALGGGTGFFLAAPFLWTLLVYLPYTVRSAGFTAEATTLWSLHPIWIASFFLPGAFGDAASWGNERFWAAALFPEKGAPLLIGSYVGIGLPLAAAGVLRKADRRWLLVGSFALFLALSLGRFGPVYPLLADLPGWSSLRFPMKWLLPAMLPLALLCARGVDEVEEPGGRRSSPLVAAILLGLVCTAGAVIATSPPFSGWMSAAAGTTSIDRLDDARTSILRASLAASVPLVAGIGALLLFRRTRPRAVALALVIVLAVDLTLANRSLAPTVDASFYESVPPAAAAILEDSRYERVYIETPPGDVRRTEVVHNLADLSRWQRELLAGYTAVTYGLPLALPVDTEALAPLPYVALSVLARSAPVRERLMILGSAGATHVVTFEELDTPLAEPLAVLGGRTNRPQRVYRNRLALARARVVGRVISYDGDHGYIRAVESGPDDLFARAVLIESAELARAGTRLPPPREADAPMHGSAAIVEEKGGRLRIHTRGASGFLVVSDTLVPGCTASLDGRAVPLLRADYAFRAVAIPEGDHEVVMDCRAW